MREKKIKHMRKSEKENKEITGKGRGGREVFSHFLRGEDYKDEAEQGGKKAGVHTDYFMEIGSELDYLGR